MRYGQQPCIDELMLDYGIFFITHQCVTDAHGKAKLAVILRMVRKCLKKKTKQWIYSIISEVLMCMSLQKLQ